MESTDVVIVGSGLAGLTAALSLLDTSSSCRVTILEKDAKLGLGNSIKASSGINCAANKEDVPNFRQDTMTSAGRGARPHLIDTLVNGSQEAIEWLQQRLEVDLSSTAQLGGHQAERTHRPSGSLPVGAEIMGKLRKAVEQAKERITILTNAKAKKLTTDGSGRVTGVEYENTESKETHTLSATHVVIATGGYTANRDLLNEHRPELTKFPITQGPFSTGDGLQLCQEVQAASVDLDKIQVHPTGFVDPKDPDNPNKFLCAEVLRGVGGILLSPQGQRFCDELGRRDYVTEQILSLHPDHDPNTTWDASLTLPRPYIVLPVAAAASISKHIEFYAWKGFLRKVQGCQGVAEAVGCSVENVGKTLQEYQHAAKVGNDSFGKTRFIGVPEMNEEFYVGTVVPVLHYCQGGLAIDTSGHVLGKNGEPIPGLHACGEVSGGVHGENRLAGNSLLECVVYGRIVSQTICGDKK
uniref:FAD-dependent oxidoreductase 2 FAD-binding domain-containing protein n=2 Tax=Amphora coffeiformis TaxID=265554 RepID=A0A7S3L2V2_9STRA|mmetsp:Transcript_793/g.1613  ORF Transcript_793/g.1613 Transcript_793/m.1613 type:complete len:468 (+) Transcript_793:73-1476(+)